MNLNKHKICTAKSSIACRVFMLRGEQKIVINESRCTRDKQQFGPNKHRGDTRSASTKNVAIKIKNDRDISRAINFIILQRGL